MLVAVYTLPLKPICSFRVSHRPGVLLYVYNKAVFCCLCASGHQPPEKLPLLARVVIHDTDSVEFGFNVKLR